MTPEGSNFQVTVNDASETVFIKDDKPADVKTSPATKSDKGVTDAPVIP